jgi:hypothetical protein
MPWNKLRNSNSVVPPKAENREGQGGRTGESEWRKHIASLGTKEENQKSNI